MKRFIICFVLVITCSNGYGQVRQDKKTIKVIARQMKIQPQHIKILSYKAVRFNKSWDRMDQEYNSNVLMAKAGHGSWVTGYSTSYTQQRLITFMMGEHFKCYGYYNKKWDKKNPFRLNNPWQCERVTESNINPLTWNEAAKK
jgi:hypothetical protein